MTEKTAEAVAESLERATAITADVSTETGNAALVAAAIGLFRLGLKRYESGNRMATRL